MSRGPLQDGAGANAFWNITNATRSDRRFHYLDASGSYVAASANYPEVQAGFEEYISQVDPDKEYLKTVSSIMLYPALFLLTAGIFIGAVWANVSWGRYWGWDPKERLQSAISATTASPFRQATSRRSSSQEHPAAEHCLPSLQPAETALTSIRLYTKSALPESRWRRTELIHQRMVAATMYSG